MEWREATFTNSLAARTPEAWTLLSVAEVEEVIGRPLLSDPELIPAPCGGSLCWFDQVELAAFSGVRPEETWLKVFPRELTPIPGLGDRAWSFENRPADPNLAHQSGVVLVKGLYLVAVSFVIGREQPADSVLPQAVALAKLAVTRLPDPHVE